VLWKDSGGPTDEACQEAHTEDAGRFDGVCSQRYKHVLDGFAVEVGNPFAIRSLVEYLLEELQSAREATLGSTDRCTNQH
jgi:hypothetical protein